MGGRGHSYAAHKALGSSKVIFSSALGSTGQSWDHLFTLTSHQKQNLYLFAYSSFDQAKKKEQLRSRLQVLLQEDVPHPRDVLQHLLPDPRHPWTLLSA